MTSYDVVIVPVFNEQFQKLHGTHYISPNGKMIIQAIDALSRQTENNCRFLISGGPGFEILYNNNGRFGRNHPQTKEPVFTREALAKANNALPLASVFKEELVVCRNLPEGIIVTETTSLSPEESAQAIKVMIDSFLISADLEKPTIGLLARLGEIEELQREYKKERISTNPIFVEDLLIATRNGWDNEILSYYAEDPQDRLTRGFTIEELRNCIQAGTSVGELLWPFWQREDDPSGLQVRAPNKYKAAERLGPDKSGSDRVRIVAR